MQLKLFNFITILLLGRSIESRPQKFASLEGGKPEVDGNGWKPIEMRSEDVPRTVLSQSRYIGSGGDSRLIHHNHNHSNIIPTFTTIRSTIRMDHSSSVKAHSIVNNAHKYQVGNEWIGETHSQRRNHNPNKKTRGYIPAKINQFGKVMNEMTKKVIPISISNIDFQDFSIWPSNQAERKIKKFENKSVFESRKISPTARNCIKIVPHKHIPIRLSSKDRIENLFKVSKNDMKTGEGRIHIIKATSKSPIETTLSNETDQNPRLNKVRSLNSVTRRSFSQNPIKNVIILRPNSKVALNSHLENWPNENVKSVKNSFHHGKYTSFEDTTKIPEPSIEEMIQWLKIPALTTDQSHVIEEESGKPNSDTFEPIYEDLEPNTPFRPIEELAFDKKNDEHQLTKPQYYLSSSHSNSTVNGSQGPLLKRQPVYIPNSQVIQDTKIHISNLSVKKSNATFTGLNKLNELSETNQTSSFPSNVRIMFLNDDMTNPYNHSAASTPNLGDDCPTIMINSITKVNNKIQSKEGCSDLNIVISSQILNTDVFTNSATSLSDAESQKQPDGTFAPDKYNLQYPNVLTNNFSPDTHNQNFHTSQGNLETPQVGNSEQTFEIIQGTNIHIGPNEPEFAYEVVSQTEGGGNSVAALESEGESGANSGSEVVNVPEANAAQAGQSPATLEVGPGEANSASSGATLNIPQPNLPSLPNLPNLSGLQNLGGSVSGNGGSDSTGLIPGGGNNQVDDDDDDDDFDYDLDISPSSVVESMSPIFSYIAYLNPLSYGIIGLAIAPFAAFAAGVLGVAAFLFPWAFPGALSLRRSSDLATFRFTPNLENFVKQSIQKYRNWNEWKSRRRKRNRR